MNGDANVNAAIQWIGNHKLRILSLLLAMKVLIVEGIIDGNWNVAIPIIVATLFGSAAKLATVRSAVDFLKSKRGPVVALFVAIFGVVQGATTGDWTSIIEAIAAGLLPSAVNNPPKPPPGPILEPLGEEFTKP